MTNKKTLEELIEIALEINATSRKEVLKERCISEKTWINMIKGTGIQYDKSCKTYVIPNDEESKSNITDLNDYKSVIEETIKNDNEFMDISSLSNSEPSNENENTEEAIVDVESLPIFANNSETVVEVNNDNSETVVEVTNDKPETDNDITETKNDIVENNEVNNDKPMKESKELIKEGFMLTKEIIKALKWKAVSENVGIDELVRDLLLQSIENKYYQGIEQR